MAEDKNAPASPAEPKVESEVKPKRKPTDEEKYGGSGGKFDMGGGGRGGPGRGPGGPGRGGKGGKGFVDPGKP